MPKPESHNEIHAALRQAIGSDRSYIVDVWPDHFVYCTYQDDGPSTHWRADYRFDEDGNAEVGSREEVEAKTTFEPVKFAAMFSKGIVEGDITVYSGKLIDFGDYPDKKISFHKSDADVAEASFVPVDVNLEHKPLPKDLTGILGKLRKIWTKGTELHGEFGIPNKSASVVHDEVGDRIPVSVEISRVGPKQVIGVALTGNPRIEDALIAAFSKNTNDLGPSGSENPAKPAETKHEVDPMSNQPQGSPDNSAALEKAEARVRELEDREKARLDADRQREYAMVDRAGEAFADQLVNEKRILPTGKPAMAAMFSLAVKDDNRESAAHFSNNGEIIEGERVKQLRAFVEALPQPALTKSANFTALPNQSAPVGQETEVLPVSDGVLRHGGQN